MTNLELSPTISRYIKVAAIPDKKRQADQIEKLTNFIKNHKGNKRRVQRKFETRVYKTRDPSVVHNIQVINALFQFSKELIIQKYEYEMHNLEAIIETTSKMLNVVTKNAKIIVNVEDFINDVGETVSKNKEYSGIKKKRCAISSKIMRLQIKPTQLDIAESIRSGVLAASQVYDDDLTYCPPSEFDELLALYIMTTQKRSMIVSIANFIAYGKPDEAFFNTIGEFTNDLYTQLKFNSSTAQVIIFTSTIRFLFDEAYVIKSDLRGYNKANAEFLVKCDLFSKRPARELKLSSDIEAYYTPGLPITSLFKSKQQSLLKELEYMTNPIDLMVRVNDVIKTLAQFFGSEIGVLSFDDTLTLFLGLMSLSPPANAVAIAKFVEKWSELLLSDVTKNSKNFYFAAIDHILKLEAVQVADDTQEFFN